MDSLETLVYCLTNGYPAPVTAAMLALVEDASDELLVEAWCAWEGSADEFLSVVEALANEPAIFCYRCTGLNWTEETTESAAGDLLCNTCLERYYTLCCICEMYHRDRDSNSFGDSSYCESCFAERFTWCDTCDEYYPDDEGHDHDEDSCDCEAPRRWFTFPADGHGVIAQNERLTVELPRGTVDDEGLRLIKELLHNTIDRNIVEAAVDSVGSLWQTKQGNFTRRLSSTFYKQSGVKLADGVISQVGNLARAHSSEGSTWHVEVTRDLNDSAAAFWHEDSCWWGGYSTSRCCLKNWGGIGLRCYATIEDYSDVPSGRAWVQPLNADLRPTHDALDAHAYVVFNGYGDLSGYVGARLIAHLSSRTYRRVTLESDGQFINNDSGYLVADEATCERTDALHFGHDPHDTLDAHTYENAKEDAAA